MSLHDLKTLIESHHPMVIMETVEECRATELLEEACAQLDMSLFEWSASKGLCREGDGKPLDPRTSVPLFALQHLQNLGMEAVFLFKDLNSHLEDPGVLRAIREICAAFRFKRSTLVLVGVSHKLNGEIEHEAVYLPVKLPNAQELEQLLDCTINALRQRRSFRFEQNLSDAERFHLIRGLLGLTRNQARQAIIRSIVEDGALDGKDLQNVQKMKASMMKDGGLLEYYPAEDNPWEMGGFNNLRDWLRRAAMGFSQEARAMNLEPPRGILLVGVQGCGKSLAARVIAREWVIPLLKLDAGRLYDKWVGESERNLRKALEMAESMSPCVLWLDEIEKAFASGNGESTDGGTSQRILATFLTWLQEKEETVFVVATANNIDSLPPELMRKGRFDEIFFVDLPNPMERQEILNIHLSKRNQDPAQFDLAYFSSITEGFSGAELEQAVIASLYRALELRTPLNMQLLAQEIFSTVPLSVSRREDIQRLRTRCLDRFVPVTTTSQEEGTALVA